MAARLEAGFLRQTRHLPADTQTLPLAAAAEPTGDPALLWRAGRDLGFTPDAASPAQAEDLVVLGSVIRFRHPLVRSAIYHGAAPVERRRSTGPWRRPPDAQHDPDRRAWHLSEAAAGPDEDVAAGLERADGQRHDPGRLGRECCVPHPRRRAQPRAGRPGAPANVADAYVKPNVFPGCFANGLPAAEGAVLAATQRRLATSTFTDQSGRPAWATIPSWDIVGASDHIITPAEQLLMAHRANAHITEINAPHLSMISSPGVRGQRHRPGHRLTRIVGTAPVSRGRRGRRGRPARSSPVSLSRAPSVMPSHVSR